MTGFPVAAICRALGMARQTAYHVIRPRPEGFYRRAEDETVLRQIRALAQRFARNSSEFTTTA